VKRAVGFGWTWARRTERIERVREQTWIIPFVAKAPTPSAQSPPPAGGSQRIAPRLYGTSTILTNPRGYAATLSFGTNQVMGSATDGTGIETLYAWNTASRLTLLTDGLGRHTSLAYSTPTNQVPALSSIVQPLGGTFSYGFNSSGQLTTAVDQLGNTSTLVWNGGYAVAAIDPHGHSEPDWTDRHECL
jgi:uncharacterized protein RhaS with RHS repeats